MAERYTLTHYNLVEPNDQGKGNKGQCYLVVKLVKMARIFSITKLDLDLTELLQLKRLCLKFNFL